MEALLLFFFGSIGVALLLTAMSLKYYAVLDRLTGDDPKLILAIFFTTVIVVVALADLVS
jgi:hypothetical protein